jgi:DNA polymerase/3'-5' exonuclease PolX
MPKTKSTDILKQFAKLQKQAEKHVLSAKKTIEKKIQKEVAAIHKKYAKELKSLDSVVHGFGGGSKVAKVKATSGAKRTRRTLPKVKDEDIKVAVSKIAAGGKKVTSAEIFKAADITRPRFNQFLKANKGFLSIEGNKRSTVYFIK